MNITIPGWVFLGIALFLIFIMVFIATGSIDDLRMRENYTSISNKPSWVKQPTPVSINTIKVEEKKSLK